MIGKDIWNRPFKAGGLSEGEAGLSLGRWNSWRARFEEVTKDENVWKETRTAAKEALDIVLRIERSEI